MVAMLLSVSLLVSGVSHAGGGARAPQSSAMLKVKSSFGSRPHNNLPGASALRGKTVNLKIKDSTPKMSFGDRVAEKVAQFAGSWKFLFLLSSGTMGWMAAHSMLGDPQLIKLNLSISIVTMLTGPLVLMSQNRSGERDRLRSERNLSVDIKAEKEITELHVKMDRLGEQLAKMSAALDAKNAVDAPAPSHKL